MSGDRIHDLVIAAASAAPDALALIDSDGRRVSYGAHLAAIETLADLLRGAGVSAGARVLIVAENCQAAAAAIFASRMLGAVAVPVNARMSGPEIARIRAHCTPRATLFTSGASEDAAAHARVAGASPRDMACGRLALVPEVSDGPAPLDVAVILYTTGTTGAPKGVMLSDANLRFAGSVSATLRRMRPDDLIYGALPLTHVFGLASMLMAASQVGAAIQLEARFAPERLYTALTDRVTVFPGVPQMHALLMHYTAEQGLARLEGSALRYVSSGAAPLDPAWKRKAEAFYGLALQNGYGMTESTAGICGTRNPIGSADTSVGPPLPGIEIRLDKTVGAEAEVGEILTRGAHVMRGYFRAEAETAAALEDDGWLRTGDLGRIDAAGNLHVVGRCKELVIRGGFNVYPPEVEAALNDHPAVVQSAVIGRAVDGDEEILAFVQGTDPGALSVADLQAFIAPRLAGYKRPSRILLVDALPAAPTGKILKHRLLDTFAARLDH